MHNVSCIVWSSSLQHLADGCITVFGPCQIEQQLLFLITKVFLQSHGHSASSTWYTTLGLGASASNADVRRAYRQLAGKWHPDKWVDKSKSEQEHASQQFANISDAYATLNTAQNISKAEC